MKRFDIQPHSMKVKDITEILIISRFHLRRFVNMGPRWSLNISLVSLWNTQTTCNPVLPYAETCYVRTWLILKGKILKFRIKFHILITQLLFLLFQLSNARLMRRLLGFHIKNVQGLHIQVFLQFLKFLSERIEICIYLIPGQN